MGPHPTAPGRTKETRSVWDKRGPEGPRSMRAHGEAGALLSSITQDYSTQNAVRKCDTWRACERHPP